MADLTGADVRSFFVVAAAIVVFVGGILAIIAQIKNLRKPSSDFAHWRIQTDTKLDNDNKRLKTLEEGNRALCRGMLALLNHEITGNSIEKLKDAQTGINNYLIER